MDPRGAGAGGLAGAGAKGSAALSEGSKHAGAESTPAHKAPLGEYTKYAPSTQICAPLCERSKRQLAQGRLGPANRQESTQICAEHTNLRPVVRAIQTSARTGPARPHEPSGEYTKCAEHTNLRPVVRAIQTSARTGPLGPTNRQESTQNAPSTQICSPLCERSNRQLAQGRLGPTNRQETTRICAEPGSVVRAIQS